VLFQKPNAAAREKRARRSKAAHPRSRGAARLLKHHV
jgi:hypothetical protein